MGVALPVVLLDRLAVVRMGASIVASRAIKRKIARSDNKGFKHLKVDQWEAMSSLLHSMDNLGPISHSLPLMVSHPILASSLSININLGHKDQVLTWGTRKASKLQTLVGVREATTKAGVLVQAQAVQVKGRERPKQKHLLKPMHLALTIHRDV